MCTLVVLRDAVRDHGLVIGANRDEQLARPASPPQVQPRAPGWLAPSDHKAGGTWIGLNRHGVFVGLVNRREAGSPTERRSRGLVVRDALLRPRAARIAGELDQLLAEPHNPFALVYGDRDDLFLTVYGAQGAQTKALGRGLHVICNRDPVDGSAKSERIRAELGALDWQAPPREWRLGFERLLGRHADPADPLENTCVHRDVYGTRSSEILARRGGDWRWWHAEGAPCEAPFVEISHLWERLQRLEDRGVNEPEKMAEESRS